MGIGVAWGGITVMVAGECEADWGWMATLRRMMLIANCWDADKAEEGAVSIRGRICVNRARKRCENWLFKGLGNRYAVVRIDEPCFLYCIVSIIRSIASDFWFESIARKKARLAEPKECLFN